MAENKFNSVQINGTTYNIGDLSENSVFKSDSLKVSSKDTWYEFVRISGSTAWHWKSLCLEINRKQRGMMGRLYFFVRYAENGAFFSQPSFMFIGNSADNSYSTDIQCRYNETTHVFSFWACTYDNATLNLRVVAESGDLDFHINTSEEMEASIGKINDSGIHIPFYTGPSVTGTTLNLQ